MKTFLSINLSSHTAKLLGGGTWAPAVHTFGEDLVAALRFERDIEGTTVEASEDVQAVKVSLGRIDARPTGATTKLQIGAGAQTGANTTSAFGPAETAKNLQERINALAGVVAAYGTAAVTTEQGSWILRFGDGSQQVPLQLRNNRLTPVSFGRVNAWQVDGEWLHELRLVQAPVAFTDAAPRILPPPPAISRVQAGGTEGDVFWNEIQALYIPPEFRGAYQLKMDYARTALLSRSDKPAVIAAAIQALDAGFKVTNPLPHTAHIEFAGEEMEGQTFDLLEPIVAHAPEGDMTFTLPLKRAELAVMLRAEPQVTLPLEIKLAVEEDEETREVIIRVALTVRQPVVWDDQALNPSIDWLHPPSPRDYIPFTADQIITGSQHYVATLGDGEVTEFAVAHGLGTMALHVDVMENFEGGNVLVRGVDYSEVRNSDNTVTITALDGAPAEEGWAIVITAAGPTSAFQVHTHTIAQIVNLSATLDELGGRLQALEERFPEDASISVPAAVVESFVIPLTPSAEVLWEPDGITDLAALSKRGRPLLPAIHAPEVTDPLPDPLPAPAADTMWLSDRTVQIGPGGGIRSSTVKEGEYVGSNGRVLYPVTRRGATNSYFPRDFERELWSFHINERMLGVGQTLTVRFAVALQIVRAVSKSQYILVIEQGPVTDRVVGDPDTSATDLLKVDWNTDAPILAQRLIVMPERVVHPAGCIIKRNADAMLCTRLIYGVQEACNDLAPASADFALRARLIDFDTEDAVEAPLGWLKVELTTSGQFDLTATIK